MYETRLLPHENDQITVSILLKNQSSSVIKELVFSMCDTPAVSLLRAVCNGFDIPYFLAYKTHCDFLSGSLEKNTDECILILVIYWKKTGSYQI